MRMAAPAGSLASARTGGTDALRQAKPEEKEKKLQRSFASPYIARFAASGIVAQRAAKEEKRPPRNPEGRTDLSSDIAGEIQSNKSTGSPLPPSVRQFMELRFRADFSKVRIHADDNAARLSKQLNAHAFTVGHDIFFGRDRFKPDNPEGRELIAHELAHTIQQGAAVQRSTGEGSGESVSLGESTGISERAAVAAQRRAIGHGPDAIAHSATALVRMTSSSSGPTRETVAAASEDGKRMYTTADGKTVELPDDMTDEDAARLEAEARAAQKKLGKGPPPQPVPDVKKLVKKEEKKDQPKPKAKAGKIEKGKGKAALKPGAAASAVLKAVSSSKVAQYLAAKGAPVLLRGVGMLRKLRQNEQTHDDAPKS